jgi:hypothetical protein
VHSWPRLAGVSVFRVHGLLSEVKKVILLSVIQQNVLATFVPSHLSLVARHWTLVPEKA